MELVIANGEACSLARKFATLTGEALTGAVTVALRERLEREQRHRSVEVGDGKLRAIAEHCATLMGSGLPSVEHVDMLHDDQGVPK